MSKFLGLSDGWWSSRNIALGFAIIVGGALWTVATAVANNQDRISHVEYDVEHIKAKQEALSDNVIEIKSDVRWIKGALGGKGK